MTMVKRLDSREQFNTLKKGQEIFINWKEGSSEYQKGNKVSRYKMVRISNDDEVILKVRGNIYFNIAMYLVGKSGVVDASIVVSEADILREENEKLRQELNDAHKRFDHINVHCEETKKFVL